jgi:hypothetical protein
MTEIRERPPSTQETSTVGPWEAMRKIRESPPLMQKMLIAGLLGGDAGDPGASTINAKKYRRWASWEAMTEIRECPPSTQETLMTGPLGGHAGDLGAPTIVFKVSLRRRLGGRVGQEPEGSRLP